ncbi:hypothetical protein ACIBJC_16300 [Streptomyces sp. NPDC050509]|uniref:hypothetical protein n=1 Tax=Streptomyces sp. NPDC050509 TaxID=3365620 RepID=UPI0037B0C6EE
MPSFEPPGAENAEKAVCARCGVTAEAPPPTWSCAIDDGSRSYLCDDCCRAHIAAIESRLDPSWW